MSEPTQPAADLGEPATIEGAKGAREKRELYYEAVQREIAAHEISAADAFHRLEPVFGVSWHAIQAGYYEQKRRVAGKPPRAGKGRAKAAGRETNGAGVLAPNELAKAVADVERALGALAEVALKNALEAQRLRAEAQKLEELRKVLS